MIPPPPTSADTPMVLVLDDEAGIRRIGRRFLEGAGYGCVEAGTIDAAIEILRTTKVIAAILDVRLPGAHSGLDMLVAFREIDEFENIPILIMTGGAVTETEAADIAKHRAHLFYKPDGFSAIISFLDQLTGRDRKH